ncbi:MAG TPA: hypothetical protein PLU71_01640 [Candidatus Dependentiae bacterium]|nr:hypothetical protein [Candidatus Dependentiae bacterium]HRQ62534.1 hypothetical protein [Candidatus Dependentiae bacterium]
MNITNYLVYTIVTLITCTAYADKLVTPFFMMRSQGVNAPRHMVGMVPHVFLLDHNTFYFDFAITPEYSRTFDPKNINACLFGCKTDCKIITISGSQVADRAATDWLADYFYLPTDFQSTIRFKPVIDNFIVDLQWFFGLDQCIKGLYFELFAPVVHSRWDLNFCEQVINPGTNDYEPGYFNGNFDGIGRQELLNNFSEYACGLSIIPTTTLQPVVFQSLDKARIKHKKSIRTRFADVRANLGWNALLNEKGRLGLYVQVAAPTGNKPEGDVFFESIVGNAYHWEIGAGIGGQYVGYHNEETDATCGVYFNLTLTHLMEKKQTRTFDLQDKPFSRYMLAQKMTSDVEDLKGGPLAASAVVPSYQFDNQMAPLANLTTMEVESKINLQTDLTIMLNHTHGDWSYDLGYNFWYRGCETIKRIVECEPLHLGTWALKGDAHVFGFRRDDNNAVALSATENNATITNGTNGSTPSTNPNIDNPQLAFADDDTQLDTTINSNTQINTSINPILISADDIALISARAHSSKIFFHISHSWNKRTGWIPFFGLGGEVEFGHTGDNDACKSNCVGSCTTTCLNCSVSQWGIWAKGGIAFE